jgi:hypothetical protein
MVKNTEKSYYLVIVMNGANSDEQRIKGQLLNSLP